MTDIDQITTGDVKYIIKSSVIPGLVLKRFRIYEMFLHGRGSKSPFNPRSRLFSFLHFFWAQ